MKLAKRGFTLVELMIVVAIIGVLAALAIYGVRRYLLNAKTSEAKEMIGRISKDSSTAFARENFSTTTVMAVGGSSGIAHHLCPSSVAIPTAVPVAAKYQSDPTSWNSDPGWSCLKFAITDSQYYMYQFISSGTTGATGDVFTALANGDLNGNGTYSTFSITGKITTGSLFVAPTITENSPEE